MRYRGRYAPDKRTLTGVSQHHPLPFTLVRAVRRPRLRGHVTASRESKGRGPAAGELRQYHRSPLPSHTGDKEPTLTQKFLRSNDNTRGSRVHAARGWTPQAGGHHAAAAAASPVGYSCFSQRLFHRRVALGVLRSSHYAECNNAVNAGDTRGHRRPTGPVGRTGRRSRRFGHTSGA